MAPLLETNEPAEVPATAQCSDILTTFSKRLEGEISADLCAEMERHVAECAHCRGTCDSLKRTLSLCKVTPSPQVPASVQESVRAALHEYLAGAA